MLLGAAAAVVGGAGAGCGAGAWFADGPVRVLLGFEPMAGTSHPLLEGDALEDGGDELLGDALG